MSLPKSEAEGAAKIIKIEHSVKINRPVKEVFVFVADLDNWTDMHPALQDDGQTSDGPMKPGKKFRQTLEVPGQQIELSGEVIRYEPNEKLSFRYEWNNLRLDVSFLFEPADGGTTLIGRGEGQMSGFGRLLEPFVSREINKEVRANLENLKNHLESQNSDNTDERR